MRTRSPLPRGTPGSTTRRSLARPFTRSLARSIAGMVAILGVVASSTSSAKPVGPRLFCDHYSDAPVCRGAVVACTECHTAPPELNPYGIAIVQALPGPYEENLSAALDAVEGDDSDGDGITNLEELVLGTLPGDASSFFAAPVAPSGDANPGFDVGEYDANFAYRKLMITWCGRSPSYDEKATFAAAADTRLALHDALTTCLDSDYWRGEALPRLADKRIRPLQAINIDGVIPLADYNWDYRLFVHALTDDRDARDLLRATYHIDENGEVVEGAFNGPSNDVGGQPAIPAARAGMITTQWFLMVHTMFSELPRTTAAQAYRAYLGQDIARSEGLLPIDGEPKDIDDKGVDDQETCIYCHATLDPLSYAFAHYNGIGGSGGNGAFNPGRPSWSPNDVEAVILDIPLSNTATRGVVDWANIAAESPQFRQTIATMFFRHALGRNPRPDELDDLQGLADGFVDDNFRAEALLHRLIDTDAFGVP